jgi:hypothetical protein
MIKRLLHTAEAEVGVREVGGNNLGSRIREYQAATDLPPGPWPWCAAFICWCIQETLKADPNWLNLQRRTPEEWRPKTALAYGFETWALARPNTALLLPETVKTQPGDLVTFDFSHIGIVTGETVINGVPHILTIEGNTNHAGTRDSLSGDGVWPKQRVKTLARRFIRLRPSNR